MPLGVLEFNDVAQTGIVALARQRQLHLRCRECALSALNLFDGGLPIQKSGLDLKDYTLAQVFYRVLQRLLVQTGLLHLMGGEKTVEEGPGNDQANVEIIDRR